MILMSIYGRRSPILKTRLFLVELEWARKSNRRFLFGIGNSDKKKAHKRLYLSRLYTINRIARKKKLDLVKRSLFRDRSFLCLKRSLRTRTLNWKKCLWMAEAKPLLFRRPHFTWIGFLQKSMFYNSLDFSLKMIIYIVKVTRLKSY